jgi:hypothetical protein
MRGRHRNTLHAVFADPARANLPWVDIEALFIAAGATISEGRGSRVRVSLNGVDAVFHRPHPAKETDKGALRSVRRFLREAGVTP